MSCCTTSGTNKFFTHQAKRYAKKYRRKGLDPAQKILERFLRELDVRSRSIIEIGCGVGGLHHQLLKHGATSAVGVDVSVGMLEQAEILAKEQGLAGRVRYVQGDFTLSDGELFPADIVILDKVVCCSADPAVLLQASVAKCRTYLAVSYPCAGLMARIIFTSGAKLGEWLRWSFHPYYHRPSTIEGIINEYGFREIRSATTLVWQVKVYGGEE